MIDRRQALEQPEPVDPGAQGWVGREQPGAAVAAGLDRVAEPEVLGAAVGALERVGVGGDRFERPFQRPRVARELDRGRVGEVLALAAGRRLDERGEERRDEPQQAGDDQQEDARSRCP